MYCVDTERLATEDKSRRRHLLDKIYKNAVSADLGCFGILDFPCIPIKLVSNPTFKSHDHMGIVIIFTNYHSNKFFIMICL